MNIGRCHFFHMWHCLLNAVLWNFSALASHVICKRGITFHPIPTNFSLPCYFQAPVQKKVEFVVKWTAFFVFLCWNSLPRSVRMSNSNLCLRTLFTPSRLVFSVHSKSTHVWQDIHLRIFTQVLTLNSDVTNHSDLIGRLWGCTIYSEQERQAPTTYTCSILYLSCRL